MHDDLPVKKALNGLPTRTAGHLWKALAAPLSILGAWPTAGFFLTVIVPPAAVLTSGAGASADARWYNTGGGLPSGPARWYNLRQQAAARPSRTPTPTLTAPPSLPPPPGQYWPEAPTSVQSTTQPVIPPPPVARPLVVLNKPIFEPPPAGGLSISAGPPATRRVSARDVLRFRIAFPPTTRGGLLSLGPIGGGAKLVAAGRWITAKPGAAVAVLWNPRPFAGVSANTVRGCMIAVGPHGLLRICAGSNLPDSGRAALRQMVVDVRLKGQRTGRIQFLAHGPRSRHARLDAGARLPAWLRDPKAKGGPADMAMAVSSFAGAGGLNFHLAGSGEKVDGGASAVWINLFPGASWPDAPSYGNLCAIRFGFETGAISSNYARDLHFALSVQAACRKARQETAAVLAAGTDREQLDAIKVLAKQWDHVSRQADLTLSRIRALKSITLRVELYPGGPVVETVAFSHRGAATQPAKNPAAPKPTR